METSPSVQDVVLNKDESMIVDSNATLKLGLRWDFFGGMAQDLDASAVFFDAFGHLTDAVYFNNLTSSDLSVVHSGDSKDGLAEDDDECITLQLAKTNPSVFAIAVCVTCYKSGDFTAVESAFAALHSNGSSLMHFSVGCHNKNTGIILCVFYRSDKDWKVMNASLPTMGRDFKELEPKIIEYLSKTNIVSQGNILEGANWNPASGKVFNLKKDETLSLPSLNKIIVGLGWDPATSGTIDIDSGCILVDDRDETDVVYFGNKESKDKSVRHGGDNLTGEGAGDDEQIHVNLNEVSKKYRGMVFTITIYTNDITFKHVKNAFVRLVDAASGKEFCRYQLSGMADHTAMVMCRLYRLGTGWALHAIGEFTDAKYAYTLGTVSVMLMNGQNAHLHKSKVEQPPPQKTGHYYEVEFVEGKNLAPKDSNGLSDPYLKLIEIHEKTNIVKKTLNPVWHQKFDIPGHVTSLTVECWDDDTFKDDFMGRCSFQLGSVTNTSDQWLELQPRPKKKDKVSGSIHVKITKKTK